MISEYLSICTAHMWAYAVRAPWSDGNVIYLREPLTCGDVASRSCIPRLQTTETELHSDALVVHLELQARKTSLSRRHRGLICQMSGCKQLCIKRLLNVCHRSPNVKPATPLRKKCPECRSVLCRGKTNVWL